jgi:hypothetical protein
MSNCRFGGLTREGASIAFARGALGKPPEGEEWRELPAEHAVTFVIDTAGVELYLWPSRFCEAIPSDRGVEIRTLDGVIRIAPPSRPWID